MNDIKFHHKRWFRIGTAISILALGLVLFVVLANTKEEAKKKDVIERVRKVGTIGVSYSDHTLMLHGNGSIQSQNALDLVTLVGGQVVYARNDLKSGLFVHKGDLLLKIDDREAQNRTRQARSGLINAIVSLIPQLKSEGPGGTYQKWNRYLEQLNMDTTPDLPEITDPQERIRVSMHNIFNQHAMVKNAEITLERHTIRAPFSGNLIQDGAQLSSWVSPGQVVASLIDPVNLEIEVPLAVSELALLSNDSMRQAWINPTEDHSKQLEGSLSRQNAHIDKRSQTVTLHVELTNKSLDPAFLPGNYMDVYIQGLELKNVALLPRSVIVPGSFVYTMEDSLLAKHPVSILATQGDDVIIASGGLPAGTKVITTILQSPIVGMRIAPLDEDVPADTSLANEA